MWWINICVRLTREGCKAYPHFVYSVPCALSQLFGWILFFVRRILAWTKCWDFLCLSKKLFLSWNSVLYWIELYSVVFSIFCVLPLFNGSMYSLIWLWNMEFTYSVQVKIIYDWKIDAKWVMFWSFSIIGVNF